MAATHAPAGPVAVVAFEEAGSEHAEVSDPVLAQTVAPGSLLVEKFRVLRAKLESIDEQRPLRCIGVVAAAAGEGTTTSALGLAVALARDGARRVLLIEVALRNPVLERLLGLSAATGLGDWLAQGASSPIALRRIEPWGVFLLSGGTPRADPTQLLESAAMAALLEAARAAFDFVVVDCPSLTPLADSVLIQDRLDGFVLVVRSRHGSRELILQGLSHLRPDRVQGVVFIDDYETLGRYLSRGRERQR
jgi:Mrp family chromosome partitioning ATPase